MNLDQTTFNAIARSITIVGQSHARDAERRSPRLQTCTQVPIYPWDNPADPLSVRIRDLSVGGIGIIHNQKLTLDQQFVIRLPCPQDQSLLALCTVLYWEPLALNLYAIGAQFTRMVDESELSARLVDPPAPHQSILAKISHALARSRKIAS
jgi:hypothetical protein